MISQKIIKKVATPAFAGGGVASKLFMQAFTLAEVLITLGIIGVVAAMTIPTIVQKYKDQVAVNSLKKVYSILSQCFEYAKQEYGEPTAWGLPKQLATANLNNYDKFFQYMKTVRICQGTAESCGIIGKYYLLNGTKVSYSEPTYLVETIEGYTISAVSRSNTCSQVRGTGTHLQNICSIISVDINGLKAPNTVGKDKFNFYLTRYGIFPAGSQQETFLSFKNGTSGSCADYSNGGACTAWVLNNLNMDYLYCPEKLDWNGKNKCN